MALEGNLRDFSLTDVLRLLQTGSKTGVLHVDSVGRQGVVCFRNGGVYHVSAGDAQEPMSKRLTRSGVISEKQLRQAQGLMKIQKKDKADRRLGQILVDEGYLEASVLESFIRNQVSNELFSLLRWEEGEIRFVSDEAMPEYDLGITANVTDLLADVGKRLEIWERIREKIPSLETRFAMSNSPGTRSTDIQLKPREWMMLCYLHGSRSVAELVKLTGYSDFDTARILYNMYANGFIEKVGPDGEPVQD